MVAGDTYELLLAVANQLVADRKPLKAWAPLFERFFTLAKTATLPPTAELKSLLDLLRPRARKVPGGYGAYFAHTEAQLWSAVQRSDLALTCLEGFEREFPAEPFCAVERGLYLSDLLRVLGRTTEATQRLDDLETQLPPPDTPEAALPHAQLYRIRAEVQRDLGMLTGALQSLATAKRLAEAAGSRTVLVDVVSVECDLLVATDRAEQALANAVSLLERLQPDERAARAEMLVARGYAESSLARNDPALLATARQTLSAAAAIAEGPVLTRVLVKSVDLALRSEDLDAARDSVRRCAERLGIAAPEAAITGHDACELVQLETRILLAAEPRDHSALRAQLPRQRRASRWLIDDWVRIAPSREGIAFLHLAIRRQVIATTIALERATADDPRDGAERALRLMLDLQARTSLARATNAPECDLASLRAELFERGAGALVYLPANEQSLLLAVDDDAVTVHDLDLDLGRSEAVLNLGHWASSSPVADVERRALLEESIVELAEQAADLVLPPDVRQRIAGWQALTVVGADLARDLPFELLMVDGRRFLGEVCAIDYTPSLAFSLHARRRQKAATQPPPARLLVCTEPPLEVAKAYGVERFPFQSNLLGELPAGLQLQVGVELADLRSLGWPSRGVVHLLAHGVRGTASQGLGLAFADGVLWQSDLVARRVGGSVIVSACGASRSVNRPGEGTAMASIAGTLLWQGADAVVVSRNDLVVDDHLPFVGDVHRALASGASLARALQSARAGRFGAPLWQRVQFGLVQVIGDGHAAR